MTIQEIINRIFIGEDMRNYLCEKADKLSKFQIQNMIASASTISLQHKLEFLEFMAQGENLQQELEESPYENDFIIKNSFSVCADNINVPLIFKPKNKADGNPKFPLTFISRKNCRVATLSA